jgi:hypothetical protein
MFNDKFLKRLVQFFEIVDNPFEPQPLKTLEHRTPACFAPNLVHGIGHSDYFYETPINAARTCFNRADMRFADFKTVGSGTFTMNAGTISGNTATKGGGVYVGGTFTMKGGTVYGSGAGTGLANTAPSGGASLALSSASIEARYGNYYDIIAGGLATDETLVGHNQKEAARKGG